MNAPTLKSRKFPSADAFVEDFLNTLTPGIIPRSNFMQWQTIEAKIQRLQPNLEFFAEMADRVKGGKNFQRELADSLLSSDNPTPLVRAAFELLGHTNDEFATKEDDFLVEELGRAIANKDEAKAKYFSTLLESLGFSRILKRGDLEDLLLGVQIGLETHRRKNVGGGAFVEEVEKLLEQIAANLKKQGRQVTLQSEATIKFGDNLSKKVDLALCKEGKVCFGFEVNFYTVSGSKPTEIKEAMIASCEDCEA